ncbi:MAG: hypothetical protein AAF702_45995 [Chloroflexota bacterium]
MVSHIEAAENSGFQSDRGIASYWLIEGTALLCILGLAGYLRLAGPETNLSWYTDEGTHVEIAKHLAQGRTQYMVVNDSTLLFAKLPLFELLLAGLFRVMSVDINTLRLLTGLLGILTVVALFCAVRSMIRDPSLALGSALLLAIYPDAIIYSRFGFSYNLLAPLVVGVLLGLWHFLGNTCDAKMRQAWLGMAALSIGMGGISDLWMFALVAPFALIVITKDWRAFAGAFVIIVLPFVVYAGVSYWAAPEAFIFDLGYTASRLSGRDIIQQVTMLARNGQVLFTQDPWVVLAIIGFFVYPVSRIRALGLLLLLSPIIVIGRTEALYHLSAYYMIPLLPLISLGVACLLRVGIPWVWRLLHEEISNWIDSTRLLSEGRLWTKVSDIAGGTVACLLLIMLTVPIFMVNTGGMVDQISNEIRTEIDPFLVDAADARNAIRFINRHLEPTDLVIASPSIAWAIDSHVADFQMVAAAQGIASSHLPANVPSSRFLITPSYANARFIIVDNTWHRWAIYHVPGVREVLTELSTRNPIFESGEIAVYDNPDKAS